MLCVFIFNSWKDVCVHTNSFTFNVQTHVHLSISIPIPISKLTLDTLSLYSPCPVILTHSICNYLVAFSTVCTDYSTWSYLSGYSVGYVIRYSSQVWCCTCFYSVRCVRWLVCTCLYSVTQCVVLYLTHIASQIHTSTLCDVPSPLSITSTRQYLLPISVVSIHTSYSDSGPRWYSSSECSEDHCVER